MLHYALIIQSEEGVLVEISLSLLIGYLLGTLSPAALLSKIKKMDLRNIGTKNLGASNTMLVLGKGYGALVMVIDIAKAVIAAKIAKWLFPKLAVAGLLAGLGAVIGHVYPFYMGFRGGKGLAAFGGMVLAYKPIYFVILLCLGLVLMIIVNFSAVMPMSAAVLFPILVWFDSGDWCMALTAAAASLLVIIKHWSNIEKGKSGRDLNIRKFIKNGFHV